MQLSRDDREETRGNVRDWWCGVAGKINSSIPVVIIELDRKRIGSTFFNHFWFKSKPDWTLCDFGYPCEEGFTLKTSVVALISLLAIKIHSTWLSGMKEPWITGGACRSSVSGHSDKLPVVTGALLLDVSLLWCSIQSTWTSDKFQISCSFPTFASLSLNADNHTI